jgi:putative transposase
VALVFNRPGKATDNPFIESFNGSFRDGCLNVNWSLSLDDAVRKIEISRIDYNTDRPHSSLGEVPPRTFLARLEQASSRPNPYT